MADDWKLKKDGGKVLKDKDFGGSANEALTEADRDATTARYSYIFYLVQKYPELQGFLDEVTSTINNSATGVITEAEVAQITKGTITSLVLIRSSKPLRIRWRKMR